MSRPRARRLQVGPGFGPLVSTTPKQGGPLQGVSGPATNFQQLGNATDPEEYVPPTVTAGFGFAGLLADPAPTINAGFANAQKPVARWTWPPYDTIATNTTFSVYAYHPSGILKVEFYLDGGAAAIATQESIDPRTGLKGWVVTVPGATLAARQDYELRAIVFPVNGPVRILQGPTVHNQGVAGTDDEQVEGEYSLFFAANAAGTLPFAVQYVDPVNGLDTNNGLTPATAKLTHHAASKALSLSMSGSSGGSSTSDNGGGVIYLLPGDHYVGQYAFPDPRQKWRWLIVTPAPGVDKEACPVLAHANYLGAGSGLRGNRVCWNGLRFKCPVSLADEANQLAANTLPTPVTVSNPFGSGNSVPHMWFRNCLIDWGTNGNSWWERNYSITNCNITYWTGCTIRNIRNPNGGHRVQKLVLNCTYDNVTEAVSGAGAVLGCTFSNIGMPTDIPIGTPAQDYPHADIMQVFYGSGSQRAENRAFANLVAITEIDAQGLFINPNTGATRCREMVIRDCEIRRKVGSPWVMLVIGSLSDGIWVDEVLIEGNRTCASAATVTLARDCSNTNVGTQLWFFSNPALVDDAATYAAAGSPAFPWVSSTSGLRYE